MSLDRDTNHLWGDTSPGRLVVIGSVVGALLAFAGVGGGMLLAGHSSAASLGLGVFVGLWGGLGFGSMMGGVAWGISLDREARASAASEPAGPAPTPGAGPAPGP